MSDLYDQTLTLARRFLDSLPERPVGPTATHEELRRGLALPLNDEGLDPEQVIRELADGAESGLMATAGPRFFGYVIGGSYPVSVAADWLTSAWDQNAGIYSASPAAAVVEEVAREWLLELLDLPREAGLGLVTGAQMANFTTLAAARTGVLRAAGWEVESRGLYGAPRVQVIVSAEAHATIHRALRFLGMGNDALIRVETDGQGRMKVDALRREVERLDGPAIVCTQAGNINTGAFDPIDEICDIAHRKNAWVHVDGAFGLWARASRKRAHLLAGGEKADSWATDGHKWLNVPYDCGIAIVREPRAQRAAMGVTAEYLQQTAGVERDAIDWVPEFSRRGRGFATWAVIRHLGRRGVEQLVDRCCDHASLMARLLAHENGVEVLNDVVLNQALIRFGDGSEGERDDLTRRIIARVQREGTLWLSGSTWKGMAVMRVSVSNWMTSEDDVHRSAEAIVRAWREEKAAR